MSDVEFNQGREPLKDAAGQTITKGPAFIIDVGRGSCSARKVIITGRKKSSVVYTGTKRSWDSIPTEGNTKINTRVLMNTGER